MVIQQRGIKTLESVISLVFIVVSWTIHRGKVGSSQVRV